MYNCQYMEEDDEVQTATTYTTLSNVISPPEINAIYRGNVIVSRDQYSSGGANYDRDPTPIKVFTDTDGINYAATTSRTSSNAEVYAKEEVLNNFSNLQVSETISASSLQQTDHRKDENVPKKTATKDSSIVNESVQNNSTKFICNHCNKGFRHKSYYEYHLRTHTGERPFQCSVCSKGFFERSKLNRHLSSCHNINTSIYEDGVPDVKSHNCPHCSKSFSRSSGLKAHLLTHQGSRPFPCKFPQCGRFFSGLTALKNHEATHKGIKSILCDICGKAFLLKKYLDLHLKTTHKKEQRKHMCSRCRKEFHSAKDLKRHQLMHSNERSYLCRLCNTFFKRKDNLNRHLKLTHLLTPEQIKKESSAVTSEIVTSHQPNASSTNDVSNLTVQTQQNPPPLNHQVSVIKSTHEVMMSITRGVRY